MLLTTFIRGTSTALFFILAGAPTPAAAQSESYENMRAAAIAGDVSASRRLGKALILGLDGVSQDTEAGLAFLNKAVDAGDVKAKAILGKLLLEGYEVPASPDRGEALLSEAIQAGYTQAKTSLGLALLWGVNRDKDLARAQPLLEEAATAGDPLAIRVLGRYLLGGWEFEQDVVRGIALLEKAALAGDTNARVSLGNHYLYRSQTRSDRAKALEHFEQAAKLGDGEGLKDYGGSLMWNRSSPKRAEAYLRRAGELGHSPAWSTLANGAMYGYLGAGSRAKFSKFADQAREAGDERIALLDAQRQMWGISMRANGPQTLAVLEQAADAGNGLAAQYLIRLVRDGNKLNIRRDRDAARSYLEKYADILAPLDATQLAFSIDVSATRQVGGFPALAAKYHDQPELKSVAFGEDFYNANPNFAFYILQSAMQDKGTYSGSLNGLATALTLRATYIECLELHYSVRCDDTVMRSDIIGALIAR